MEAREREIGTYRHMKTDRSRLMGSKEPSGYFCEAFSYIRFLLFRESNYSIKTNRQPAVRRSLEAGRRDVGCVELMSSRTNGITSLLVTCDLFEKRWRCLLWFVTFLFRASANGNLTQPIPVTHPFVPVHNPTNDQFCYMLWWKRQKTCLNKNLYKLLE